MDNLPDAASVFMRLQRDSQNRICDAEAVTILHETRISGSALEVKKRTCPRGRKGTGLWGLCKRKET